MSEINIISTGDPDEDRKELERAVRFQNETDADRCPNGCGQMFKASERQWECTECGFILVKKSIHI